ncbi:MAG: hypothetical protein H6Q72_4372 [Firmicutes bacterium]|nr:hypothetical protein [Bacillota bacterium]
MGFFDSLFGGGKKPTSKKKKAAASLEPAQTTAVATGLSPEVIAVIAASVNMVLGDEADAAVIAAVTAAIIHARNNGVMAVEIKRAGNAWGETGRQKIMDARL